MGGSPTSTPANENVSPLIYINGENLTTNQVRVSNAGLALVLKSRCTLKMRASWHSQRSICRSQDV